MWLSGAELKHLFLASIDPLKWWVHSKGHFFLFFFGEGERFETEAISSGGIDVERLLDGLAAEELALFVVLVSEMFENFE